MEIKDLVPLVVRIHNFHHHPFWLCKYEKYDVQKKICSPRNVTEIKPLMMSVTNTTWQLHVLHPLQPCDLYHWSIQVVINFSNAMVIGLAISLSKSESNLYWFARGCYVLLLRKGEKKKKPWGHSSWLFKSYTIQHSHGYTIRIICHQFRSRLSE